MSLQLFSEKIFAVMETYEELTARWTKAVAEMEATVDEYQELEKEEVELVEQMTALKAKLVEQLTAHKAKLVELEAKCCEKDKDMNAGVQKTVGNRQCNPRYVLHLFEHFLVQNE